MADSCLGWKPPGGLTWRFLKIKTRPFAPGFFIVLSLLSGVSISEHLRGLRPLDLGPNAGKINRGTQCPAMTEMAIHDT
jgi:hypothetical protein